MTSDRVRDCVRTLGNEGIRYQGWRNPMSEEVRFEVPEGSSVEVVRNLRDGDVVWITIPEGLPDEYIEALHDSIESAVTVDATILVAPRDLASAVQVLSLPEMLAFREILDAAIQGQSLGLAYDE